MDIDIERTSVRGVCGMYQKMLTNQKIFFFLIQNSKFRNSKDTFLIQSNLAIRNFLVALKLFLNAISSLSL